MSGYPCHSQCRVPPTRSNYSSGGGSTSLAPGRPTPSVHASRRDIRTASGRAPAFWGELARPILSHLRVSPEVIALQVVVLRVWRPEDLSPAFTLRGGISKRPANALQLCGVLNQSLSLRLAPWPPPELRSSHLRLGMSSLATPFRGHRPLVDFSLREGNKGGGGGSGLYAMGTPVLACHEAKASKSN